MHQYQRITAKVGKWERTWDSKFEYQVAQYLQLLLDQGEILQWTPQPICWDFFEFGYRNKPFKYTIDFECIENDNKVVYIEAKGRIQTYDLSRIRRANKHYGPFTFDLYMQRIPKRKPFDPRKKTKKTASQILAQAECNMSCIRRIVDFSEILKQCKGLIKAAP